MEKYTEKFADEMVRLCLSKYESLRKTGKPKNESEWTLVSCFVQEDECSDTFKVVALGTGSKCIGSNHMSCNGDVVHDSHAEVVARRTFILYLMNQVRKAIEGHNSIFEIKDDSYCLKSGIWFHFYTSHTPCGDASIFPKQEWLECVGNVLKIEGTSPSCPSSTPVSPEEKHSQDPLKETLEITNTEPPLKKTKYEESVIVDQLDNQDIVNTDNRIKEMKRMSDIDKGIFCTTNSIPPHNGQTVNKVSGDIFRTGAKCVSGEASDPQLPGSDYHVTGVLRTKPGRGDPTLSLSCSDKMFKWSVLGVQGALLMLLLSKAVYVKTIIVGQCPYSQEAMTRAIYSRFKDKVKDLNLPEGFSVQTPLLLQSHISFPHCRSHVAKSASEGSKLMPTPTSIIWSDTSMHTEGQEVITNGRRLGCTKKNLGTPKSRVSICRKAMAGVMIDLLKDSQWKSQDLSQVSYKDLKCSSKAYIQAWNVLKSECLTNWTVKPKHLQDFKVMSL